MLDHPQAQSQCRAAIVPPLAAAIPIADANVHRPSLDAMRPCIAHQLRGCVETHRLAVDERRAECRRFVVLQPGGDVDEQCEARAVRLRKSVFSKPQYLIEYLLRETLRIAAFQHAVDQLLLKRLQAALAFPGRHRAPQTISLARRKAGRHDGELHDLFLENRHTQGAFENRFDVLARIAHGLLVVAAAQGRMHHLALNRTGTHDGHLDHQIVVVARPEAWQHGHLSPRFDLKDPDGVSAANHVVHRRILARHRRQIEPARHRARTAEFVDQIEGTAYRGKHAERQHIDFEQSQRIEVVLVPLDDRALRHRRVFNGNQFIQAAARYDEAAHVLRYATRKSQDLRGEFHEPLDSGIAWIETRSADALWIDPLAIPPLKAACQPVDFRKIQSQCLAHVAQRAAGPVRNDGGGESRALAAVFAVNVLNDLFAPLVLEIHVDVRRFVALLRDEALEQHGHARRIHLGDFQAIANNGVSGRAPPLAEYFLRPGILHDVVHGEKARLELESGDEAQFMLDALAQGGGYARRPALRTAFFGQRAQMAGGSLSRGYDLLRIFVAQLIERERTALGDDERLLHQWRRIELL